MSSQTAESADRAFILRHLPVFPAVALELIDLVDQRVSEASKISRLLGRDPALSAEVLRQANSARFARRHDVSELDDAVTLLGTDQTCRIAMGAACRGLVAPALGRPELRRCWEHCLASAILASALAAELDQEPGPAYTAGLLHDIGLLALVAVYPDRYVETLQLVNEEGLEWLDAERQVFGADHCGVGRWVVDEWRLPDELHDVVVHHHDERPFDKTMVSLVAMASTLADIVQSNPMERMPWDEPAAYLDTLPIDRTSALALIAQAVERINAEIR
jgi:putative nucleotidyltransferase with HDIG domain